MIHIEAMADAAFGADQTWTMSIMRCGLVVRLASDGTPSPAVDWVLPKGANQATCPGCIDGERQARVIACAVRYARIRARSWSMAGGDYAYAPAPYPRRRRV